MLSSGPLPACDCSYILHGLRSSEPWLLIQNVRQHKRSNVLVQIFPSSHNQSFLPYQKACGTHIGPQTKPSFLHIISLESSSDFHLRELKENFPSFSLYLPSPCLFAKINLMEDMPRSRPELPGTMAQSQPHLGPQASCSVQCNLERRGSQGSGKTDRPKGCPRPRL